MRLGFGEFARLLRWEWKLSTAGGPYKVAVAFLCALTALAFGLGYSGSQHRREVIDRILAQEEEDQKFRRSAFSGEEDFEAIAGRSLGEYEKGRARTFRIIARLPISLAYSGSPSQALLPPAPLAPLSVGHSDLWPDRSEITAWSKRSNLEREEIANPFLIATGPFDPSSLVAILLPLTLIVLTHDLISADRERGVLGLTLSQPTPYLPIVLARLLVRAGVPTALVIFVAACGLLVGGADPLAPETASGFALWAALALSYAAAWAGIALAVNSLGGSSIANAILMMTCWVAMVAVIPSAIAGGAALASPVSPRSELITREREVRAEAERNGEGLLKQYYLDHPELTPPTKEEDPYGQARWDAIALEVDRRMKPAADRHRDRLAGRIRFTDRWQALSPALAVKAAMDDVAGTSLAHHLEFADRARDYHTEFMDYLRPMMMTRRELSREEFDLIPGYGGYELASKPHPASIGRGLLVCLAWAAATFLFASSRLRRPIAMN